MICSYCKGENEENARYCIHCGKALTDNVGVDPTIPCDNFGSAQISKRWVAFTICLFVGVLGIHRFYAGKIGTGVLWLLTGGLFGIGYIVDLIMLATGNFRDSEGILYK